MGLLPERPDLFRRVFLVHPLDRLGKPALRFLGLTETVMGHRQDKPGQQWSAVCS
jgi:hypothetical protein